jgi:hypothetical protein
MRPVRTVIAIMFAAAIAVTGCTAHSSAAPTPPSSTPVPSGPATTPSIPATSTTSLPLGRIQRLDAVQAVGDTRVVWAVGKGTILTTSNGGRSWARVWRGTQELREVDFVNASTGWAVGDGVLLGTIDGGQHWRQLGQPRRGPLRRVHFSSPTQGWGVAGGTGQPAQGPQGATTLV